MSYLEIETKDAGIILIPKGLVKRIIKKDLTISYETAEYTYTTHYTDGEVTNSFNNYKPEIMSARRLIDLDYGAILDGRDARYYDSATITTSAPNKQKE
jgi:hypothetical protein